GAFCYRGRTTAEQGELIKLAVEAAADEIFGNARGEGRAEPAEAYAVDALVSICERSSTGESRRSRWEAQLRLDAAALRGGSSVAGETCEIPGVGPIPVTTARELLGDALLKIIVTEGVDVKAIVHPGRTVREPLKTAMAWLSDECEVAGCHR